MVQGVEGVDPAILPNLDRTQLVAAVAISLAATQTLKR